MPTLTRPNIRRLEPDAFWWCTGIEDTFISARSGRTGRRLDEYELTDHYGRWSEDLALMAGLGVGAARYGIPWYRINPAPGKWDWTLADRPLGRLLDLGIEPIIDLVHYGVPDWIEGAFADEAFPDRLAEYARRVAERYRGTIFAFTPLNEPRITAWYAGRLGWWPPNFRSWRGFAGVLASIARGIALASAEIRSAHPWNLIVHADGADNYRTDDAALASEVLLRQEMVYLPLGLVSGQIGEGTLMARWLMAHHVADETLEWHRSHPEPPDILGLNVYPMFSNKVLRRASGRLRLTSVVKRDGLMTDAVTAARQRWNGPLMITETATRGSVRRRQGWLEQSVSEVKGLREAGCPVIGYTWWPMISHVAWAYREGGREVGDYLEKMGLWDLHPAALDRQETAAAVSYRSIISGGVAPLPRQG